LHVKLLEVALTQGQIDNEAKRTITLSPSSHDLCVCIDKASTPPSFSFEATDRRLTASDIPQSGPDINSIKISDGLESISISRTNSVPYYLKSFSASCSPKLFSEFNADVCISINDYEDFINRIINRLKTNKQPLFFFSGLVQYYSPLSAQPIIDITQKTQFIKDKQYKEQQEYRIVIIPVKTPKLEPIPERYSITIGNIEDITSIHSKK